MKDAGEVIASGTAVLPRQGLQLAPLPDGGLLVRHPEGGLAVRGRFAALLPRMLSLADGVRTVAELEQALPGEPVRAVFTRLLGKAFEHVAEPCPAARGGPEARVGPRVLGTGELGRRVAQLLACQAGPAVADPAGLAGAALVICALEELPYSELFALQHALIDAGVPSLFATADADGVRIGPATVPGVTPCLGCSQLALWSSLGLPAEATLATAGELVACAMPAPLIESVAQTVALEARQMLAPRGAPDLLRQVLRLTGSGVHREDSERVATCPVCSHVAARESAPGLANRAERLLAGQTENQQLELIQQHQARAEPAASAALVASVGVLGGGTAGYLSALALRRLHPELRVTLIESAELPIIGVGEATTPILPHFLHVDLGLDPGELFRRVRPTLKLGIRFLWGLPERGDFHYPFGPISPLEAEVYGTGQHTCSLQSLLMAEGAVPLYREEAGWVSSLGTSIAYHLDNQRFVAWLRDQASAAGVERTLATIVGAERSEGGEEVVALIDRQGRRFARDLWIDASGFGSFLLEKTQGSPWLSYADSLWTDRAVVAQVPHGGAIRPYTTAETFSSGWCWSIPQVDADHRGYVFASACQSDEQAEAEMRRACPGMEEARLVRFRAGRHAHFWRGNVVALGNAYGFVEPLESTALHMLVLQLGQLLQAFPLRRRERGLPRLLDRRVGEWWDYLRWFLALHFRFNRRLESPFWRDCRRRVDVASHGELLEAFRERGPLAYDPALLECFDIPDPRLWGAAGVDAVLLGQGVRGQALPAPRVSPGAWRQQVARARRLAARAAPHGRALELLAERDDLLQDFAAAYRAAGPLFALRSR